MLPRLEDRTYAFWMAAKFHRRHSDRNQAHCQKVLRHLANQTTGTLHCRVTDMMKEIESVSEPANLEA